MKQNRMRLANKIFNNKKFLAPKSLNNKASNVTANNFILQNPEIDNIIAECVAHFRLINWRLPIENSFAVQKFFIDLFIPEISAILNQKKQLTPYQKVEVEKLCQSVIKKMTQDPEVNAIWGTTCLVEHARKATLLNFIKADFFLNPPPFRAAYLKAMLSKKDIIKSGKKDETREFVKDDTIKFNNKIFDFYRDAEIKNSELNSGLRFFSTFILCIYITFGKDIKSITKVGVGIILVFFLYTYLRFSHISPKPLKELRIKNFSPELRAGLLNEVYENLIEPSQESKKIKEIKQTTLEDSKESFESTSTVETTNLKPEPLSPKNKQQKPKIKTRSRHPSFSQHYEESENKHNNEINSLLQSTGLTLFKIIWETQAYGVIEFVLGYGDTFQLWSKNKRLEPALKLCFVHFPRERLEKENDYELVAAFREIAEIGQYVSPKGHTGYVKVSENEYKIKGFSKLTKDKRMLVVVDEKAKVLLAPEAYNRSRLFFACKIIDKSAESIKKTRILYR